jgi:hypothetical protein
MLAFSADHLDVLDASEVTDINVGRNLPSCSTGHELALLTGTEEEFRIFTETIQ